MKNLKKHPEWLEMLETFKAVEYDSRITYKDLNKCLIGGDVRTNKTYVLSKFRKELLRQHKRYLENVRNDGYRVVKPNEHSRIGVNEIVKARRRVQKSAEVIINVDYDKLSVREQGQVNLLAARIQNLSATLIGEQTAVKKLAVNYTLPR